MSVTSLTLKEAEVTGFSHRSALTFLFPGEACSSYPDGSFDEILQFFGSKDAHIPFTGILSLGPHTCRYSNNTYLNFVCLPRFWLFGQFPRWFHRKQPAERREGPSKKGDLCFPLTPLLHFVVYSNPEFSFTFGHGLHRFLLPPDSFSKSLWNTCSEQSSGLQGTENPAVLPSAGDPQFH